MRQPKCNSQQVHISQISSNSNSENRFALEVAIVDTLNRNVIQLKDEFKQNVIQA
jgi:hypothetical protein